ncbi:alpha/beta hydrolase [Parvularcula sp. ZS-1/3]|uniref:Alpha/beta hydrolase n=1 Tax=Parvularcula mediterranea TaxID=2732508 RepID=A0A7Y3RM10_9PROT|nr:alpha/beta hydrolase [Parvularcula mediterranea]NNU15807.1 alpha/beta hydrolase [Parvularcula mediterranea]
MRRPLFLIPCGILAVLAIFIIILWTPDTDREAMKAKYGGEAARYSLTDSGMEVHYRVSGPEDAPALILIHGTSSSLHTWEPLRALLDDRYRVVAYDQPGHGLTGPHPEHDYTYPGMAAGLDAVFEAESIERAVLIGNSMGGWVAWVDALENPERVEALVLIDALGIPETVDPHANPAFGIAQSAAGRLAMRKVTPRGVVASSIEATVADPKLVDDAMIDRYWELLRLPGNRRAAGEQFISPRAERSDKLSQIEQPTLIIWGEEDALIFPLAADEFERRIPNARSVTYADVGHLPMEEAPARTARDISEFLEANLAGAPLAPIGSASDIPL